MKSFTQIFLAILTTLCCVGGVEFSQAQASLNAIGSTDLCQTRPYVTLVASPANANSYVWYFYDVYGNLNQLPAPSTNTFDAAYTGYYHCVVTDNSGTYTTNDVMVSQAAAGQYAWNYQLPSSACGVNHLYVNTNNVYFSTYQWIRNGQPIPGATSPNYDATTGGNYNCRVGNSCGSDTNQYGLYIPYVAQVIPAIVPTTSSVGKSTCTATPFSLSVPAYQGASYKWYYLNANGTSTSLGISTPVFTNSGFLSATTMRYYCAIDNACSSRNSLVDTIVFTNSPAVTIQSAASSLCNGDSLLLTASTSLGGLNYQWFSNGIAISGKTQPSCYVKSSAAYTVQAGNGTTCTATSPAANVTAYSRPAATISAIAPTTICSGDSVVLTANTGSGLSYAWKKYSTLIAGASSSTFSAKATGTYRAIVTNVNGCTKQSNAVSVSVNALPTASISALGATTFCQGGSVLLQSNSGSGLSYAWKKNGSYLASATAPAFTATLAGTYRCQVTNSSGCSKTSNGISVSVPCRLADSGYQSLSIAIGAEDGGQTVHQYGTTEPVTIDIYDAMGRFVFRQSNCPERLTLPSLPNGIYLLTAMDANSRTSQLFSSVTP